MNDPVINHDIVKALGLGDRNVVSVTIEIVGPRELPRVTWTEVVNDNAKLRTLITALQSARLVDESAPQYSGTGMRPLERP